MKTGYVKLDGSVATFEELEATIRAEVLAAKAEGWRIEQGTYYVPSGGDRPSCCPLGACVRKGGAGSFSGMSIQELSRQAFVRDAAADILGLNMGQAVSIVNGFDGAPRCPGSTPFYDLGVRLRDLVDDS